MSDFIPRPAQQRILAYQGGKMGVSAVPGSGKTATLSKLAANIIEQDWLDEDQEVLIVTLVNSAVDNFTSRINKYINQSGLLPGLNYRVRTLHGLSNDIVRERPDLLGLDSRFEIVDEAEANRILESVTISWLSSNPNALDDYLKSGLDPNRQAWVKRERLPYLVKEMAAAFIRYAKDNQFSPKDMEFHLEKSPLPLHLAQFGLEWYRNYQRSLAYRGAVDFDDLIRLALEALELDQDLLERLQLRWPFILEDEAQDSSRLQQNILEKLTGEDGNWVRVGDPNQAIYETFTTANPKYLREFLRRSDVSSRELPNSGRSTNSIITLANYLIDWTKNAHPVEQVRQALDKPYIQPAPEGDPQENPPDAPDKIHIYIKKLAPDKEVALVVKSLKLWLAEHTNQTVAVLVPRNMRGVALTKGLETAGVEYIELLRSTQSTRKTAGALGNILQYLSAPQSASKLARAFKVWRRDDRQDKELSAIVDHASRLLAHCSRVEAYLWPEDQTDSLDALPITEDDLQQPALDYLRQFQPIMQRWQQATILPIDQLVLTLAQDLFTEAIDLALAHKLAILLKRAATSHPHWRLPELTGELASIAQSKRRFVGFSQDDTAFDPAKHPGQVVVTTAHKAKGLEWDRVYLMSVNNYDFPSAQEYDPSMAEKWYIRDHLDMQSEILAQINLLGNRDAYQWYEEGAATRQARMDYAAERLRLLYVGITRAKQELIITWNTGRRGDSTPALPLVALHQFWKNHYDPAA